MRILSIQTKKKFPRFAAGLCSTRTSWLITIVLGLVLINAGVAPAAAEEVTGSNVAIRSGAEIDYPPFSIVGESGEAGGFSVELMRAVLATMGREVTFRTGPWAKVRGWLERGEIDALPLVGRTPEREALFDFTVPYMSLHGAIVVRGDETGIRDFSDLSGRRVAVMKDDNAEEFLRRKERDFEIRTTPTFEVALQELAEGRHDAVVTQRLVALRLIQKTGLTDLKVIDRPIEGFRQDFCFAVHEGDRGTLALLNEGLAIVVANGTYRHLHAKWFAAMQLPTDRPIIVGGDRNFPPFEFLDENGHPAGYNVELTRAIAHDMGLNVEIRLGRWPERIEALKTGKIDVLQGMFYSPGRDVNFDFTQAHTVSHYVAVVRKNEGPAPERVEALGGKRIVVERGDILHDFALENGLEEQVTLVDDQEIALRELAGGRHYCALVSRVTALYLIDKHGWTNLVLGKKPLLASEYCYAAAKGQKALLAQFGEGLKTLENSGEYRRIYDKWLGVYQEQPTSFLTVLRYSAFVIIPLLVILLAAFVWSWSLRKQMIRRTADLAAVSERHQAILASVPDIIMEVDADKIYTWANPAGIDFFGEDVIGREASEFFVGEQDTYDRVKPLFNGNENVIYVESWQRRKDGQICLLAWWCRVLKDKKGMVMGALSTARDITAQKQTEETLQRSEAQYRLLVENQTDLVVKVDLEGRFLFASPSYCRMFGKKEENLLGKKFMPLVHEEDRDTTEEAMKALCSPPHTVYIEQRAMTKQGWLWLAWVDTAVLDSEGNVKEIIGVGRDISARKQAEEEIQKRDIQFSKLSSHVPGMIYQFMQKPDGNFCVPFTNEGIRDIFGCSPQDVKDDFSPIAKVILPEDLDLVFSSIKKSARQLTPWFCEYRVQIPDQPLHWIEGRSTPEKLDDGSIIWHGFVTDITERKQAEEALASSFSLLRIAGETAKFGGWSVDLSTRTCTWSETVADIHDMPRGYAPPVQDGISFYAPEYRDKITRVFMDCAEKGIPYDEEMEIITRKGERVWIRSTGEAVRNKKGEIVKVQGSFQDITNRKRTEEELRQNEERYRDLVEAMPLSICESDTNGNLIYANRRSFEVFGYKEEDLKQGLNVFKMIAESERKKAASKMQAVLTRVDRPVEGTEYTGIRKDSSELPVIVYSSPIVRKDRIVGMRNVIADITALKRTEQEREKLRAQLIQAQKMESVGRLAGGVAHDYNNMLSVIIGYTEMAVDKIDPEDSLHDDLKEILEAAKRSAEITRQLLAFARQQTIDPKVLDLNETVESMLRMLRRLIGEDIDFSWEPGPDLWPVKIDPSQLDQILANLCVNARDAISNVGKITIETDNARFDEEYCADHAGFIPGEYVLLAVSDDGSGIEKEILDKIFDPFFTTKDVGKGTGLGLAMIYGIVKQNKGFINVYSEPGKGTTIKIYLPRPAEAAPQIETETTEEIPLGSGETVLVVEDEASILKLTQRILKRFGYKVLKASTPQEAMICIKEHPGEVHLLITDVIMPEMNGRDLAKNLLNEYPNLKVLFMSGYTANVIAHRGVLDAGVHFIQKPFSNRDLAVKVRKVITS